MEVLPTPQIHVEKGGKYFMECKLVQGRVGFLGLDYEVQLGPETVVRGLLG